MNKIKLLLSIIGLTSLLSCNRTDFSNPEEVMKSYRNSYIEHKNEIRYDDFLSAKSKEFVTKDEYIKYSHFADSIQMPMLLESKISTLPIDVDNPSLRRVKVDEKWLLKSDTGYSKQYYTLINENGKWKVIWTETLHSLANKKYDGGNYSEARKTLQKIIEIDPYNGSTYDLLAWCYFRDNSLPSNESQNGVVKNAKYALTLEEDVPWHYNTLAAYYGSSGNLDLAVENFERGLKFCQNKEEKTAFYSNLAHAYIVLQKYDKAEEYITKSIKISNEDGYTWFQYGSLMEAQQKFKKAIEYYSEALNKPKMENSLQGVLFYHYAYCCKENGNCLDAKEYINKALDIEPDDNTYQSFYNDIKNCK